MCERMYATVRKRAREPVYKIMLRGVRTNVRVVVLSRVQTWFLSEYEHMRDPHGRIVYLYVQDENDISDPFAAYVWHKAPQTALRIGAWEFIDSHNLTYWQDLGSMEYLMFTVLCES